MFKRSYKDSRRLSMELRKIVFRGKSKHNGEWVYGSYIANYNNNDWIVQGCDFFAVDSDTVCQFTGYYDKYRKEIYEGDRLYDFVNNVNYLVYYNYYQNSFDYVCLNMNKQSIKICKSWCDIEVCCRVVGNIFDNPELLEK